MSKGVYWKGYNPTNSVYQKMSIERSKSFTLDIPKCAYWMKMWLLTKNVSIEWKGVD